MAGLPIGDFQVLNTLGTGAHSSILHIHRSGDGKQYALKVVNISTKEELKFFDQASHEFRVAQMVNHPNLIKIFSLETQRDWFFRIRKLQLLIEYVNGKTLDKVARLSLPRLVQVFAKVAAGLEHMHRRGVYHADLKPNNVLLSRSADVKIIDYGLAWIKGEDKNRVQGTPEYMAPEQAREGIVNEQTDIYNLGAMMYRLVTWRLPPSSVEGAGFKALTPQGLDKNLKPVGDLNPQAPPALCDLIHQCLQFRPEGRPESIAQITPVLEKLEKKMVRRPEDKLESLEW